MDLQGMATVTIVGLIENAHWETTDGTARLKITHDSPACKLTCYILSKGLSGGSLRPGDFVMASGQIIYAGNNQPYTNDITIMLTNVTIAVFAYRDEPEPQLAAPGGDE